MDVRVINELVHKQSRLRREAERRGRQGHRRPARHDRAHPDRPAHRRPRAARGRARPGQDADGQDARRRAAARSSSASSSRPTCCRPTSIGTHHLQPADAASSPSKQGPIFANLVLADEINRAPAKVQRALLEAMQERQVTIGDTTLPAARAVPRHGDAEPDRAGGHLPAARGAARSLHADDQGRLPDARGRARDHGPHDGADDAAAPSRSSRPQELAERARGRAARSTSTTR